MEFAPQMNACCEKVKTICLIGDNVILPDVIFDIFV